MKSVVRLSFIILLSAIALCTYAQEKVYFAANAPQAVVVGDEFRIAYTLNTEVESGVESYLSDTKNFVLLTGPARSRSLSVKMINGVHTNKITTTYTYTFQVNREGDYTIPYCRVKTKRGTYQSNTLLIKVLARGSKKIESSITSKTDNSKPSASKGSGDMFVQVELSNASVSTNDSLTATVKFYSQRDIISLDKMTFPTFEGFTVREMSLPETRQMVQESYKGKKYYTTTLRQYMLHPKQDGQLTITSGSYHIIVPQKKKESNNSRDFFDSPKHIADTVTLISKAVTLTVHPSPIDTVAVASASTDNAIESYSDSVKSADNELVVEKPTVEKENSKPKFIHDDTRKVLLYCSAILLLLLLVVYFSKLRTPHDAQYAQLERNDKIAKKLSFRGHLSFIAGIIFLIGCIVVLW